MTTFTAIAVLFLLALAVAALLERTNRRTAGQPHAPYGGDGRADSDLRRVRHDLDAHRWA